MDRNRADGFHGSIRARSRGADCTHRAACDKPAGVAGHICYGGCPILSALPDPEYEIAADVLMRSHRVGGEIRGWNFTVNEFKGVEELAERLAAILPPGLKSLRAELEDNFRAVLRANLERWDLVSRERFDVQAELLARTQARLKTLESRLAALEQRGSGPATPAA